MAKHKPITTIKDLDELLDRVQAAQSLYETFDEQKVDAIFKAAATAA